MPVVPRPRTRRLSTLALIAATSSVLVGADCLGPLLDDDDAEEPLLLASDSGFIGRLAGTDTEGNTVWTGSIATANRVSMVEDGGSVYYGAGSTVGSFVLLGTGAQEANWTWSAPDDVVALAGPGNGTLFVMTTSTLHGLSIDGGEIWTVDLLVDLSGVADDALGYSNGDLILGGDPTRRLDPSDGSVTHTYATGSSDVSALTVAGGLVYLASADGVVALSSATLDEQWTHATSAEVDEVATSAGGVAYAVRGGVVGFLANGGNPVFDSGAETGLFDGLAISQNVVLAARADGALLAFDEADGSEVWSETLAGPVGGLDANDITVFFGHGDVLEALALSDGSSLWRLTTSGSPAAVLAL